MTKAPINLLVALPPEAKPINQHFGLVRDNRYDRYPLYRNDRISLVISGCGAQNSADATAWLYQINDRKPDDIWINPGIAGHPTCEVGTALLVNEIEDVTTGDSWMLESGNKLGLPAEKVFTVAEPDTDYSLDGLVDMEAAGFYRSALECSTPDRIYCLKVISDNSNNQTDAINGKMVSQLIRDRLDILDELIRRETDR